MNSRDLDNWITGHYGEDYFKDEDAMDDKQDIVVTMQISLSKQEEAIKLAEFLQDLLDMMEIEGIVSYKNENNPNDDYTYGVSIHEPENS